MKSLILVFVLLMLMAVVTRITIQLLVMMIMITMISILKINTVSYIEDCCYGYYRTKGTSYQSDESVIKIKHSMLPFLIYIPVVYVNIRSKSNVNVVTE